ncbi:hypothetical protein GOP47_0014614 [Adiantum capillus-veneris]|uniref:Secreted protein n=1 Tax=Adiantum capillus-veneris TaxID=13818 RepID=A0A9D4ZF00_ADICA|nr:hypothetical protein GOP47_0014614 [Adiantum capillus-veneris]
MTTPMKVALLVGIFSHHLITSGFLKPDGVGEADAKNSREPDAYLEKGEDIASVVECAIAMAPSPQGAASLSPLGLGLVSPRQRPSSSRVRPPLVRLAAIKTMEAQCKREWAYARVIVRMMTATMKKFLTQRRVRSFRSPVCKGLTGLIRSYLCWLLRDHGLWYVKSFPYECEEGFKLLKFEVCIKCSCYVCVLPLEGLLLF